MNNQQAPGGEDGLADSHFQQGWTLYDARNYEGAAEYFHKAAEAGHAFAQFLLGEMCAKGEGVAHSPREAAGWYRKAAEAGDTFAERSLRAMAEAGDAYAQHNLGLIYYERTAQDLVSACQWFEIAHANGARRAARMKRLAAAGMTPEQLEEATSRARAWMEENAK